MYSSSATSGDFERFIAHDVVDYIDADYRTIPERLAAVWRVIPWAATVRPASA